MCSFRGDIPVLVGDGERKRHIDDLVKVVSCWGSVGGWEVLV